jgi:hypothetical protein
MDRMMIACFALIAIRSMSAAAPKSAELITSMAIDVDGAPNAYGPAGKPALDFELNAHRGAKASGEIVGYLTKGDGRTPEVQGPQDPFPGYYISTTAFQDKSNPNRLNPQKYVDAAKINYVVLGNFAAQNGAKLGDFVAVHSKKTGKSVFGIIGDAGNSSGAEGSLALLQALGLFRTAKRAGSRKRRSSSATFRDRIPITISSRVRRRSIKRLHRSL